MGGKRVKGSNGVKLYSKPNSFKIGHRVRAVMAIIVIPKRLIICSIDELKKSEGLQGGI